MFRFRRVSALQHLTSVLWRGKKTTQTLWSRKRNPRGQLCNLETLEQRHLLAVDVTTSLVDVVFTNNAIIEFDLGQHFTETATANADIVQFSTNAPLADNNFFVELYDNTPITVDNFLSYVADGSYDNSIIHRSVSNFVVQGGGFSVPLIPADQPGSDPVSIPTKGTIQNEPGNLNNRGTIAMAKSGGQTDSATSQFFFNLKNNSSLDGDNGGYTAFGEVLGSGMTVVDTLASALTYDATSYYSNTALSELPLWNINADNIVRPSDFVTITSIDRAQESDLLVYSAVSSDPTIVSVQIDDNQVILNRTPGAIGTANVAVTATSLLDNSVASQTFTVTADSTSIGTLPMPRMLGDLNLTGHSRPKYFVESGDTVYFSTELTDFSSSNPLQMALWKTGGSASTTEQIGVIDGLINSLISTEDGNVAALVTTMDSQFMETGLEVWHAGDSLSRIATLNGASLETGEILRRGNSLEFVNGKLIVFGGVDVINNSVVQGFRTRLWAIDPTTTALTPLYSFDAASPARYWYSTGSTNVGDALYFIASDSSQSGLWRTDGTTVGTAFLRQDSAATPAQGGQTNAPITVMKGEVFYSTDGGVVAFDPLNTAPGYTGEVVSTLATVTRPTHLTAIGDDLYFLVSEPGTFDPMTGTFVGGGDTVFVYNHLTQTTAQVFSTNQLETENARIHSIAEVDGSCVIGAGVSGNYTVGTTGTGEFWSVSRNPEVAIINNGLLENAPTGTVAGQLVSLGITSDTPVTYSLVSGQGDDNNDVFSIDGNSLKTSDLFDYELTPTLNIRVRATTANGTYAENALVIQVGDVNESPIALDLAGQSVSENVGSGTTIGFFSTFDPDVGDVFTYSFTSGTGDTDNNVFSINGDQLQTKDALDHEAKDSYTIRVQSSDSAGNAIEGTFVINVLDENDEPTAIQLSSATVQEGVPIGTELGIFSTTDADFNDSHIYQLVSGEGDEANHLFAIDSNKLVTNGSIEFEAGATRSIRVRSFDLGQSSVDSIFQITVTDVANPLNFDVLANTNDSTPIITGIGVPNEIVYLSADFDNSGTAETTLGIALVGSSGEWAIASTTPLPEGTIALSAYATDSAGNRSDEISSTITTDYTAPSAPLFNPIAPTNNASPTISGTGEVGATVQLWADLEARGTATVPIGTSIVEADGTWSIVSTAPLPEGTISLLATQTDPVGNESGPNLDAIIVDTTPPDAPIFDTASLSAVDTSRPTLTGTGEMGASIQISADLDNNGITETVIGTEFVEIGGVWILTPNQDLPEGTTLLNAIQIDSVGNASDITVAQLELTTTPVNQFPTSVSLFPSSLVLPESSDTSSPIFLSDILIADDGLGTNTISLAGADVDAFEVIGDKLYLKAGTNLDYEQQSVLDVSVHVRDLSLPQDIILTAEFTLTVEGVPDAGTDTIFPLLESVQFNGVQLESGSLFHAFTVLFSEPVTGVDGSDFEAVTTGGAVAAVGNPVVTGTGSTYTVLVAVSGEGQVGVNVLDNGSIRDLSGNPLRAKEGVLSFADQVTFATGFEPQSLRSGDLNNDGHLDFVVATNEINRVDLFYGDGTGAFSQQTLNYVHYATTPNIYPRGFATDVAIADLNGDGLLDIGVADWQGNTSYNQCIWIKINNGNGTFQNGIRYSLNGGSPGSITFVDVNNDSSPDMIAGDLYGTNYIRLNNGDGSFGSAVQVSNSSSTGWGSDYQILDVNSDGMVDLVGISPPTVSLGNGDGSFQSPSRISHLEGHIAPGNSEVDRGAMRFDIGDLNNDGIADIVFPTTSSTVAALLGADDGTFDHSAEFSSEGTPFSVAVADFDGDGFQETVSANHVTNTAEINYWGYADGTIPQSQSFTVGRAPHAVITGDWNADGRQDIAVVNLDDATLGILFQQNNQKHVGPLVDVINPENVNQPPTSVTLLAHHTNVPETASTTSRLAVGSFTVVDDDKGINTVTITGTDADSFEIDGNILYLKQNTVLDYEEKTNFQLSINAFDATLPQYPTISTTFTLVVDDIDEAMANQPLLKQTIGFNLYESQGQNAYSSNMQITDSGTSRHWGMIYSYRSGTVTYTISLPSQVRSRDVALATLVAPIHTPIPDGSTGRLYANQTLLDSASGVYRDQNPTAGTEPIDVTSFVEGAHNIEVRGEFSWNVTGPKFLTSSTENDALSLAIYYPYEAPTDLTLSTAPIAEDAVNGTVAGSLLTIDADIDLNDRFTYQLVDGIELNDNAYFEIVGSDIVLKTSLDYESKNSHSIRIRSTDGSGLYTEKDFVIHVEDVDDSIQNQFPTSVSLFPSSLVLPESSDTSSPIFLSDILIADDGLGTNTISLAGADVDAFEVIGDKLYLKAGTNLDYEQQSVLDVSVHVRDLSLPQDIILTAEFTLTVEGVPDAGTDTIFPLLESVQFNGVQLESGSLFHAFTVLFSEPVTGVDGSDFEAVTTGGAVAAVGNPVVTGTGSTYTVLVAVSGEGQVGVNVLDNGSIRDLSGNPLRAKEGVLSFADQVTFATGFEPQSLRSGDLNNDGHLDFVVATNEINRVDLFYGDGTGAFSQQTLNYVHYATTPNIYPRGFATDVAIADLNGDGLLDIGVADWQGNTSYNQCIWIKINNGNGTFQNGIRYSLNGGSPGSITFVDVNNDSSPDMIAGDLYGTNYIRLNNGDGSFGSAVQVSNSSSTGWGSDYQILDVNSDGMVDLVGISPPTVSLGNGDGSFQSPSRISHLEGHIAPGNSEVDRGAMRFDIGDLNNDGIADIVFPTTSSTVAALLGADDGTFDHSAEFSSEGTPFSVAVADFDGDGFQETVSANHVTNTAEINYWGYADGTIPQSQSFTVGRAPHAVITGDWNADGRQDIAVVNLDDATLGILFQQNNQKHVGPLVDVDNSVPTNTPPVLDASATPQLISVLEDAGVPVGQVGTLVSDLIDTGGYHDNFSDIDGDLPGIAITGVNLESGTLYYSTDDGATWLDVGAVSDATPRLLAADATTRLYFEPAANYHGLISDVIQFRAWDGNAKWTQLGLDIDGDLAGNLAGEAVSLSADGRTLAFGAIERGDFSNGTGYARILSWNHGSWNQLGQDITGDVVGDQAGESISLSDDGRTIAVGATGANSIAERNLGRIRVYQFDGLTWNQLGETFDGNVNSGIGHSISLSGDGQTIAFGNSGNSANGTLNSTRIYRWNDTAWHQLGSDIVGEEIFDFSGTSVSLARNGQTVAIGAPGSGGNGDNSGHTRIFDWGGTEWVQRGIDIDGEAPGDNSGYSVALSADSYTVAIGAHYNNGTDTSAGHTRVYRWDGITWSQLGEDIDGEAFFDYSGYSVSLSADGQEVAIGAHSNDANGPQSGHTRIYSWNGNAWIQLGEDIDGEAEGDFSGCSVSIAADGKTVAIGAGSNADNGIQAGHTRIFQRTPSANSLSASTDTISITVTPVNDRPVLTPATPAEFTFQVKSPFVPATMLATGDFNQDGFDDLAGSRWHTPAGFVSWLGQEDLENASYELSNVERQGYNVRVADMNGDGYQDAVNVNHNSMVNVYINDGEGSFTRSHTVTMPHDTSGLALGDFDNDGDIDAVAGAHHTGKWYVLVNPGNGELVRSTEYSLSSPEAFEAADFDGDGFTDVAVSNLNQNKVRIYFNDGSGAFTETYDLNSGGSHPFHMRSGDVDGDNDADLIVTNHSSHEITVLVNNGNKTFSTGDSWQVGGTVNRLAITDWNKDGIDDFVTVVPGTETVWAISPLDGEVVTYQAGEALEGYIAAGDFNGDQVLDIAVGSAVDNSLIILSLAGSGGTRDLDTVAENTGAPVGAVGTLVTTLLNNSFSDVDGDPPGIAITDTNLQGGSLYYSIDDGATWSDIGSVSERSARVLYANSGTRLAFEPATDFTGSITDVITFLAYDRSTNIQNGGTVAVNETFVNQVGGGLEDMVVAVSAFDDGSTTVLGIFDQTITLGNHTLTNNAADEALFIAKLDQNGEYLWATKAEASSGFPHRLMGLDTSSDGSVYISGAFEGIATFGSTTLTNTDARGLSDIFVAKLNSAGDFAWAKHVSAPTGTDSANALAVNADGSVLIGGAFEGTATFGSHSVSTATNDDLYISKLSSNGVFEWVVNAGNQFSADSVRDIEPLADGSALLTGYITNTASFGPHSVASAGDFDIYVARIDAHGDFEWATRAGGSSRDGGVSLTSGSDGSAMLTGFFSGSASFGSTTLSSQGGLDIFVASLNSSGQFQWAERAGGAGDDEPASMAVIGDDQYIVGGYINNDAQFGQTLLQGRSTDAFLATFEKDNGFIAAVEYGDGADDKVWGVSTLPDGKAVAVGYFRGGTNIFGQSLTSVDDQDGFIAHISTDSLEIGPSKTSFSTSSGTAGIRVLPVANANRQPTDVTINNLTVGENQQGATVGTFSTVDPDTDDTFTYSLVSGAGDGNNTAFYIEGDVLKTASPFDYETTNTANIRVRSTDSGGLSLEKTFTISVSNSNEPPTDIALSTTTINENAGAGARVGQLTTFDPDDSSFGTTFTYELVAGSGDTDNELFEISGDQLLARSSFDYEADSSYSIRLRTTDWPGFSFEEVFTIDVGDVNEAPTSVSLTNLVTTLQSDTNTEAPTLVADIEIQDDALGTNQISLTGDHAGLFTVIDSAVYLVAGATLDPENSPLSFTVVVSDPSITTGSGNTIVRFSTNAPMANPDFLVELTSNTPLTNANFLSYVNSGAYDDSIFHRSVPNFVIQGGGISAPMVAADQPGSDPVPISTTGTVLNEPGNPNVRGTIAMAKLGGQPDSATNQFFFNLNTNPFLDTDNGGYTVFGNVLNDGMTVIDTMAGASTHDATTYYSNTALSDLPLWNINQDNIVRPEDFVKINSVSVVPSGSSVSDSHTIEITAAPTPGPETEFLYSFNHVNEAGADDYLVSSTNMRRYSEWQSPPLTYWGPSSNDQEGQLVYKFPLSGLTTSASLYASSPTWDFFTEPGGYGRGASALEVSNDGETWVSLHNNLEPRNWGGDWTFDDALPAEALGTTELWVRMRFYVENAPNSSYTVAQFGRSTSAATTPAFGLNVTMTTEAPPNTPPTGEVIIFGTAAEDQILSAKNSLVDADGIGPISYQWSRNSVPVSGATDEHYTLMQADVGSQITLTATYTDDRGTVESINSAPTAVVQNINDVPTGTLTITGAAIEDSVLSADTSDIADEDGLGPFSYQWIRNGEPITGAITSTYQLSQDDVQANLAVTVNYVDDYGHNESLHAVVNDPIANLNDRPVLYTDPTPTFNSVPENAGAPTGLVGTPVTSLIDSSGPLSNFFDEDGDLPGIAVTETNLQGGTLWQSQDGGTTWNPVGIVSETAPLLLEADADNRLYFQPSENFFGTISDVISFKAWDRTGTGAWQQLGGDFDGEAAGNRAGRSVSVSADGNTIVISEHGSDALWTNSGKVHAYRWTGNDWQQLGESILGEGSAGWSVSMADDGNRIAVGSPWAASTGHASVYSWTGEEWQQTGQSLAGINNLDRQGWSVALSGDGNSLVVGANNDDASGEDAGKTTIYRLQNDEWVQVGSPILGEAAGDESGSSVTISQNGEIVAIGARYNDGNGTHAGHAQVFEWNGSEWQQLGVDLDGAAELFRFGSAVSLSSDGHVLAVGAPKDDTAGASAGRTFVYDWNGVTWELRGAPIDGEMSWGSSGLTVSLSNDGDRVAVGAPYNDGAGTNAGHAQVYQWTGSTWSQVAGDMDGEVTEDKFGQGIAISGDGKTLIAGAWLNDGPGPLGADTGHARVFRLATLDASVSIATDTASIEILSDNVDRPEVVLSQATIQENRPVGTQVGTLSHNIADDLGQYTYSLVHDGTPDDNLSFNLVDNNMLMTNSVFDYEAKQSYTARIRAVRDDGFQFTSSVTITVTDVEESVFHFIPVGNPGNTADPATGSLYGDVGYEYSIGQYEITIGQYTEFLNAVAASDPYGLYNSSMASDAFVAGINRAGTEGSFSYTAMAASGDNSAGAQSAENRPITYVDWHDAARLANWMHNGRGPASTEDGAYRLNGATGGGAVARSPYAKYSVPTEDEWYKAAYYSPELNGGSGGYYAYATQSNTAPGISIGDTANQANYFTGRHATTPNSSATYQAGQNYLTDVGAFSGSTSYYGTFDQTGNVWEWNDLDGLPGSQRGFMGGMWNSTAVHQRSDSRWVEGAWNQRDNLGFRLVELDPTPPPSRGNTGVVEAGDAEGFAIEKIATIQNQLFTEDGLFVSVGNALSFSTVDSQELYVIRKDTATNSLSIDAAATPWKSQLDTTVTPLESFGSVELQRDSAGFLYANNQPITANGQHLSLDSFAGWSIVAADTVNGVNQLIWQNAGTGTLMPWVMDSFWSRVSTLASIDPSDTQSFADVELAHGVDLDNDGMLGGMTYVSPIGTDAVPPIYVAEGLNSIFFAAYSREFGIEPWVLPLGATTGDRFEVNNTLADATNLSVLEGLGGLRDLSIHVNDDIDVYRFEVTASGTSQDEIRIVSSGSATLSLYGSDPHNVDSYQVNTTLDPQTSLHTATISPGLIAGNYHLDVRGNGSTAPFDYQLDWSLPTFVIEPDIFEPNDTQQTASEIWVEPGQNVLPPLTLHSHSDTDWYRFETIGDGTDQHGIQISSLGMASGTLYDSNGAQVGTVNTAQNGWLSLNGLPAGSYTLEVFSPTSNQLEYSVTIHAPEEPVTSDIIPRLLGDLTPGIASSSGHEFFSAGDYTYFLTDEYSPSPTTLWSHRRHTQSPQPIATIPASVNSVIETSTGHLAFAASNENYHQLWMSDGTPQGTYCVWDFVHTALANGLENASPLTLAELDGQLIGFMPIADATDAMNNYLRTEIFSFGRTAELQNGGYAFQMPPLIGSIDGLAFNCTEGFADKNEGMLALDSHLYFKGSFGAYRTDGMTIEQIFSSPYRNWWYPDNYVVTDGTEIYFTFQNTQSETSTLYAFNRPAWDAGLGIAAINPVGSLPTTSTWLGTTGSTIVVGSNSNNNFNLYTHTFPSGLTLEAQHQGQNHNPLIAGERVYYHVSNSAGDDVGTSVYMLDTSNNDGPTLITQHTSTRAGQAWLSFTADEEHLAYSDTLGDELWIIENPATAVGPTSTLISTPWLVDNDNQLTNNAPTTQGPRVLNFQHGDLYFWTDSVNHGSEPWILPLASLEQDTYEPNNSFQEATDLQTLESTGSINNLTIHEANDTDVFRFDITQNANESHFVAIDLWNSQAGDLDLELYQLHNGVEQLIDASASVNSQEFISMRDLPAGSYYIKVVSFDGRTNGYNLSWNLPVNSLLPDEFEPGNIIGTFVDGYFSHENLTLHTADDFDQLLFTLETIGGPNDFIHIQGDGEFEATFHDFDNFMPYPQWSTQGFIGYSLMGLAAGSYGIDVYPGFNHLGPNQPISYQLQVQIPVVEEIVISPDWAESNNNTNDASQLGTLAGIGELSGLTLHTPAIGQAADEDFFQFDLHAGATQSHGINLNFSHFDGDIDAHLLNANGQILQRSTSITSGEHLNFGGLEAGTYFLKVFGKAGPTGTSDVAAPYTIDWSAPLPGSLFPPDIYEVNNLRAEATDLRIIEGAFTLDGANIHNPTDRDWYQFEITDSAESRHFVEVQFTDAYGNLDARLYNSVGRRVTSRSTTTDNEKLSLAGLSAGTYFVEVFASPDASGGPNMYSLVFNTPSDTGDRFEINDSRGIATNVGIVERDTRHEGLSIHTPSDSDFFRFELATPGRWQDEIIVEFAHAAGDLEAELTNELGHSLDFSVGPWDNAALSLQGLPSGIYYLEIYGFDGATNDYSIHWKTPSPETLPPDWYEPPLPPGQTETPDDGYWLGLLEGMGSFPNADPMTGLIDPDAQPSIHNESDHDFWLFETQSAGSAEHFIDIAFENIHGDLDAQLHQYTPQTGWSIVDTASTSNNIESLSLDGLQGSLFCLEVVGFSGDTNTYAINWNTPVYTPIGDDYEPNDVTPTDFTDIPWFF